MQPMPPYSVDPEFATLMVNAIADGIFTLDEQGVITSWNPAMERISGYSAREAIGKTCDILNFNLCFGKRCPSGIGECRVYENGQGDDKECFLRHKNGHDVLVAKSARRVLDQAGHVRGVVETITDLTELQKARRKAEDAAMRLCEIHRLNNIIGKSKVMLQIFASVRSAAASEANVLLQGESGTGKELVAGAIHYNSERAKMPFVAVNCSALPETLLESELFGHVKGAFTGANRDRIGRFEEADGGTLFLDEIGEISPFIQIRLLRVLQERIIERVGESKKRKIDIRIITATNKDLFSQVGKGVFREDLYYRLKVFPIDVPPLRMRKEDLPLLISHFIQHQNHKTGKRIKGVDPSVMRVLMDYNWPGNVRELENAVEHAFVLCAGDYIGIFDLPVEIRQLGYRPEIVQNDHGGIEHPRKKQNLTRDSLVGVLAAGDWNKAEAARHFGVSRAAIWKYMKKWDIPMSKAPQDSSGF
ncbi:MAG: sigma-54 interaction domain-containing protein [Thermodesulfobacteriota bacterium]